MLTRGCFKHPFFIRPAICTSFFHDDGAGKRKEAKKPGKQPDFQTKRGHTVSGTAFFRAGKEVIQSLRPTIPYRWETGRVHTKSIPKTEAGTRHIRLTIRLSYP